MGAPLNPVPEVLRVFLEGYIDTENIYKWGNVLHFAYSGGPPSHADCDLIAAHVASEWSSHMAPECPSPTSLQSVTVVDLSSTTSAEGAAISGAPGTRGDDSIPANAAMLVSYVSPLRYRGGHPRTYLYVGGNADLEGAGKWSSAFTAEAATHWDAFLAAIVGFTASSTTINSFGFVRYRGQYLPNGGPPHYYLDTPLYESLDLSLLRTVQEIASQRRRVGRRKS